MNPDLYVSVTESRSNLKPARLPIPPDGLWVSAVTVCQLKRGVAQKPRHMSYPIDTLRWQALRP